jgi:hypothetical protein
MNLVGKTLMARRAGCVTEQSYSQGIVTRVRDGVIYTRYPNDKAVKVIVPSTTLAGHYRMTIKHNGFKLPPVDIVDLQFIDTNSLT